MVPERLAPSRDASQHEQAPRPLPLFLAHVARVARDDPTLAARALQGLRRYEQAPVPELRPHRPVLLSRGGSSIRDCGGSGQPVLLIPSLINPPEILDLDAERSFADALARAGMKPLLLDWGAAADRAKLDVGGHVTDILVPLVEELGERPALVGYCLGGTMALAAARLTAVDRVATLAAPWHFSAYPQQSRDEFAQLFASATGATATLGVLPMEVLQSAFWSLVPDRIVAKFAAFAGLPPGSADASRFVTLERWANAGEPLPGPAARELVEHMFGEDRPGRGLWRVGGTTLSEVGTAALHLLALNDPMIPAAAAPPGLRLSAATGHIGLVLGRHPRSDLHPKLFHWLLHG